MINYTLTQDSVSLIGVDGEGKIYTKENQMYEVIRGAILKNDQNFLKSVLTDIKTALQKVYEGFDVKEDVVSIDGEELPQLLGVRLKLLADENKPYSYVVEFWKRLKLNPSMSSVRNLFDFMEHNHVPFSEDHPGFIVCYKAVNNQWKDYHTNTFDNSIGEIVEVQRNSVDDDRRRDCSWGLHVGGFDYASGFGSDGHLVLVLVDPADVVSVPLDCNCGKMRVCKYKVLKEVDRQGNPISEQTYSNFQVVFNDSDDDDDDDDDDLDEDRCFNCGCYDCEGECEYGDDDF